MPFLVDSVTIDARPARAARSTWSIHPQLVVRRDVTGELLEVLDAGAGRPRRHDALVESWMHVEIDRETDRGRARRDRGPTCAGCCATSARPSRTGPRCATPALRVADELAADPPPLPDAEVAEAWELLRWLADDHFTFLGYREYDLATDDATARTCCVAVPGTGLGILRADQRDLRRRSARCRPRSARKAREPRLLVLTKANSRSTVHRPAYLDYVGVKTFDADGQGHRRAPLPRPVLLGGVHRERRCAIPVLRRKVARGARARPGFAADSHAGKDLLRDPGDLPARRAVPDRAPTSCSPIALARAAPAGAPAAAAVPAPGRLRPVHVLPGLPAARPLHHRRSGCAMQQILLRASCDGDERRLHRPVDRVGAGPAALRRPRPTRASAVPRRRRRRARGRLAEATRSWADDFADALHRPSAARSRPPSCSARYARRVPRGATRRTSRPRTGRRRTSSQLEALDGRASSTLQPVRRRSAPRPASGGFKIYRVGAAAARCREVLPVLQRHGRRGRRRAAVRARRGTGAPPAWIYDFGLRLPAGELPTGRASRPQRGTTRSRAAVARRGRGRRLQRAGAARRADLAAGDGAARVREVPAPGRHRRSARSYIEQTLRRTRRTSPRCWSRCSRPASTRRCRRATGARADRRRWSRRSTARSTRSPASTRTGSCARCLDADPGDPAHQLLPARRRRPAASRTCRSSSTRSAIPDLPAPRPRYEIWVYSPRVEGVHLRFGAVARGGLRWSDRREDFRTEVLGLVKAQMVKNAVIVPVGAKGGFVVKQPPRPGVDRDAVAGRGHRLLPDVHLARCSTSPTTSSTAQVVPPPRRGPARRRRPLPRRRRRQGHRDVLRHRQRDRRSSTASGSATRSPPAARSATTTRRWASPPAAPGSR